MVYSRIDDIEDSEHEVLWIKMRPRRLPRQYSCIMLACVYHPPDDDNGYKREHMTTSLDTSLRCHPDCGVILTGDFNQFSDTFLRIHYGYKELVKKQHATKLF